jgi:organic hydroperoxide reductase OsmC/OhrA
MASESSLARRSTVMAFDRLTWPVEAAHQVCPYSHATRGNIDVKITVV